MKTELAMEWQELQEAVPRDVFKAELKARAKRIGVDPWEIRIRSMKKKWGSCSTAGRLTFDAGLLMQHAELRRRVIVEELLHLRVSSHGKLFKSLLRAYLSQPHLV